MSVSAAALAALSDGVKVALIGAFAVIAAAAIPIMHSQWRDRRSVASRIEQEESAKREYAEREESASAWQFVAGQLTSEFGTMTNRVEDVAAARETLKQLQGASQSQLHDAFGRDSMLVCAERHIRQLMQAALDLAEEAVKVGDTDKGRSSLRQLAELNSSEIDVARWNVFEAEAAAWREQPDRDVVQPASALDARVKLSDAVQRHCAQRVECDLLPDREI